ncbi:MAG: hypothetical protein N2440_03865 [Actinobacteria bacterium]|nr:hypothetical protein [Actinomycetota bacterium]
MNKILNLNQTIFRISLAFLVVGVLSAAFSPSEKTIGKVIGLVYLHVGFFIGSLALLLLTILFGIFWKLRKNQLLFVLNQVSYRISFFSWVVYFILSALVARLSWGGVFWQEPRMIIAVRVIFIFLFVFLLDWFFDKKFTPYFYTAGSLLSIGIWIFRFSIMHPRAPIRNSDVLLIKVSALVSIVFTALSIVLLAIALSGRKIKDGLI